MTRIIPAILATSEAEYVEKLRKIEGITEPFSDWVQIDLMDSKFVQNQSIDCSVIQKYSTNLKMEAHLMVEYPESWFDDLVKIPSVQRIVFPVEVEDVLGKIQIVKSFQKQVGLSINPGTDVTKLAPFADLLDAVLVMSVEPGFGGQAFIVQSIDRVREIKNLGSLFQIGVDGGVGSRYIKPLVRAGADYLVIGSHLLEGGINENLRKLQETL